MKNKSSVFKIGFPCLQQVQKPIVIKEKPKQIWQKYIKMPSTCARPKTLKMNPYIT